MKPDIRRLTNAIVTAGNSLLREAGRLFKPHGISAAQFNVLNLLSDQPDGLRACDLTDALVVDPSSVTYLLDRMEDLGWVKRADDKEDRRAWRILLTPAGREMHKRVEPLYLDALERTLEGVDSRRITQMADALLEIQVAARAGVDQVLSATHTKSVRRSSSMAKS